jgi:hypothetical protein
MVASYEAQIAVFRSLKIVIFESTASSKRVIRDTCKVVPKSSTTLDAKSRKAQYKRIEENKE